MKVEGKSKARRRSSPDEPALTREVIVEAALTIIDEAGLDGFSLRNLAQKLGVYPTAIYWYVPTRNELLAQVVAHVLSKCVTDKKRRSLQAYLQELFQNFRKVFKLHPNMAPLIGTQLVSNTNVNLEFVEQLLSALSRAGLSGTNLVGAYNTVIATLVGFAAQEFARVPTEESVEWQAQVRERLATINRDDFPVLASNLPLLSNRAFILRWQNGTDAPLDESFRIYVDIVIAGIEKLIADSGDSAAG